MAKMTPARVRKWHKDFEKAAELIKRALHDIGDAKLTTPGTPNHARVIDIGLTAANIESDLSAASANTTVLLEELEAAAQARKDEQERRAAAKAAASGEPGASDEPKD